jgi:hypothetical protein
MADMFVLAGELPAGAHPRVTKCFGLYKKLPGNSNGRPSYAQVNGATKAHWFDAATGWVFGDAVGVNAGFIFFATDTVNTPMEVKGPWQVYHPRRTWVDASHLHVYNLQQPGAEDDVTLVGMRTPAERHAEGRKRALDLDCPLESIKRPKVPSLELRTDVAKARSISTANGENRFKELFQPAIDAYAKDELDEAELKRRKNAARQTAATEYPPLADLDEAGGCRGGGREDAVECARSRGHGGGQHSSAAAPAPAERSSLSGRRGWAVGRHEERLRMN